MRDHSSTSTSETETTHAGESGGAAGKTSRTERVYRKASGEPGVDAGDAVASVASSAGAPLPTAQRSQFESSLGTDLSSVRVHTGSDSAQASADLSARAFTTGNDIHFGAGQYQPEDPFGVHLLAHEVAHTVQQGGQGGGAQTKLEVSEPGDALEVEADRAADAMVTGAPATVSAGAPSAARKVHRFGFGAISGAVSGAAQAAVEATMPNATGSVAPPGSGGSSGGASAQPGGGTGRPMLRVGSQGPDVEELQRQLTAAGQACSVDGKFGPGTRGAVVAFQRSKGLAADGIVGPITWGALGGSGGAAGGGDGAGPNATPPAGGPPATTTPATTTGGGGAGSTPATTTGGGGAGSTPATTTGSTPATTTGGPGPDGPQPGGPATPGANTGNPVRDAIVAAARSKIGTVFSYTPAAPDETGDATRTGWQTLTEIFDVAFPSFPKQIIKYHKYGRNNGKEGSSSNGLVSWCGIFATWAVMTGGGTCGPWDSGPRCSSMSKVTSDPKPGDVGYFHANQHHCIIARIDGNTIETIDGNSYDADAGGNGAITTHTRSRGDFAGFFKQVND